MEKHWEKILTLFLTALLLLIFNISRNMPFPEYKILKVENADEFYLDLNRNNTADENELVKLYDINTFHPTKDYHTKQLSKATGMTTPEALAIGVLAKDFAVNNFTNKLARVEFYDTELSRNQKFIRAKLYLKDKEISKIFMTEGFAVSGKKETGYKKYLNFVNLHKNLEKIKKENFVIVNTNNNTYHELTCKYAQNLKQAYAIKLNELPKDTKPCQNCILHQDKSKKEKHKAETKNFDFQSGVLHFFFTDFNKRIKPDKDCQNAGCKTLLKQINSAKNSIDFAIYGIDNQPKITDALISAQKRGVKIRWVTDENTKGENIYSEVSKIQKLLPNYKTDNHKSQTSTEKDAKYINSIMHNKFFIFDDKSVWFGSANISQTDLADFNANIIIFADSKTIANIFKQEFEQMYNEKFHNLKQPIKNKENLKIDDKNIVSIYFSPTDKIVINQIVPKINNAKKSIYISSFIITHPMVKTALIKAKNRGTEIKIIIDATSASGKYTIHKEPRNAGISVKVENKAGKMHTKLLIIDDIIFVGSMNLTKSGENKNDESMLALSNPNAVKIFKEQFLYLWNSIPEKWLYKNPRAEGRDSYGSCFDGIDNDFDGDIDSADDGCKSLKH